MPSIAQAQKLDIAIIGGGITGLVLAIGLKSRGFKVKVYEKALKHSRVEAGVAFTPNTEWAMRVIDPRIYTAFKKVVTRNTADWLCWINAYGDNNIALSQRMYQKGEGFEGCQRPHFIGELVKLLPASCIVFGKQLDMIQDRGNDKKLTLGFQDKTTAEADMIFGCDGVCSRVRELVLGEDDPASCPEYNNMYAFRGLIPWEKARAVLGEEIASNRYLHVGAGAHAVTSPVADGQLLNVVAFVHDPNEWPDENRLIGAWTKKQALKTFEDFAPVTRAVIDLLPDELHRWAILDTYDYPAATHIKERLCLVGNAAHAASPHHGAGAGMGVEDAAALVSLLELTQEGIQDKRYTKTNLIQLALQAYDRVRQNRTLWLVEASRVSGELYEWQHGREAAHVQKEVDWRARKAWSFDIDEMNRQVMEDFIQSMRAIQKSG